MTYLDAGLSTIIDIESVECQNDSGQVDEQHVS